MYNARKGIEKLFVVIIFLLPLVIVQASLFGGKMGEKPKEALKANGDFILTAKEGFLSLRAKDVSLKKIIEEIGHRMKIEVVGNIPEEKILAWYRPVTVSQLKAYQ